MATPVEKDTFRRVMGSFASGVTVITACEADGTPRGFTASAVASLSLEPRLLLIAVNNLSTTLLTIQTAGAFALNIMATEQQAIAQRFAGRSPDKFSGVNWEPGALGVPILHGSLAHAECRVTAVHPGGDHTILVGEVVAAAARDAAPLLYFRGNYGAYAGAVPSVLYPTEGWEIW